jgi:periplasmic copper chaperone A
MKTYAILFAGLLAISAGAANAQDYKLGALEIETPWAPAVPKGSRVAAGYLTIKNTGSEPDRLVGVSSPIAGKIEIHQMSMDKGIMSMRPLPSGLEIKPGTTVEFKPSSLHLMIMGLKQPIEKGKPFKASLNFEKAGPVDVEFMVEGIGASAPPAAAHDAHHH